MTGQYQAGQGFVSSPRMALAQALLQQGASTAPLQSRSPLEGIARMLTAGVGGWVGGQVKQDQKDALAEALKALDDPNLSGAQRAQAAYRLYGEKSPDTPNPFESVVLAQSFPKSQFVDVKNAAGQVIGQRDAMTNEFKPNKLENISQGQQALNAFGEVVASGGPKLGEGQVYANGTVSTVPGFAKSFSDITKAGAVGRGEGEAQTAGAIEAAKNQPLADRAGLVEEAQRNAQNNVPVAPPGWVMGAEGMKPYVGGPQDPDTIRAQEAAKAEGAGTKNNLAQTQAGKLRDDFNALPTVKSYREVVPIYASMKDAATRDSKAADLNMVYGLAKIMDPGSVVREGEIVMANDTQGLADRLNGFIRGIQGEGRLRPQVRQELLGEAASRVDAYKQMHDQAAAQFTESANRAGVNPRDVILSFEPPKFEALGSGAPKITDDAAGRIVFERLPVGAPYIGPDGLPYTKPGNPAGPR